MAQELKVVRPKPVGDEILPEEGNATTESPARGYGLIGNSAATPRWARVLGPHRELCQALVVLTFWVGCDTAGGGAGLHPAV